MKKNAFLLNLSLLMFTIVGFFSFLIGNIYYLLIASIIPIAIYIFTVIVSMDRENIAWLVFMIFMWVSALISRFPFFSYKFMLAFGMMFAAKLIYESVYGWHEKFSKFFYICAFIHVAAIALSLVIPDTIQSIVNNLYVGDDYDRYIMYFDYGAYLGLNRQGGAAAFFASVLAAFSACSVLCENKKGRNYILTLISVIAIFLTVKRSFLISNAIAIVFCFFINNKTSKMKNILKYALFIISAWVVLSFIPEVQTIFLKFERLLLENDISNGRFDLWERTIKLWKDSPLFGLGINTLSSAYGVSSHNVYLQLLAEMGIFGLLSFIIAIALNFYKSCTLYVSVLNDNLATSSEKALFLSCIYMQIIFIIYCFVGNPLYDLNFLLIYILSVACIKSRQSKKQ